MHTFNFGRRTANENWTLTTFCIFVGIFVNAQTRWQMKLCQRTLIHVACIDRDKDSYNNNIWTYIWLRWIVSYHMIVTYIAYHTFKMCNKLKKVLQKEKDLQEHYIQWHWWRMKQWKVQKAKVHLQDVQPSSLQQFAFHTAKLC